MLKLEKQSFCQKSTLAMKILLIILAISVVTCKKLVNFYSHLCFYFVSFKIYF